MQAILRFLLTFVFLASSVAQAAIVSGVVESVSPTSNSITIRIVSQDRTMTFRLAPTARVTIGTKTGKLDAVEIGQTATIFTGT